MICAGCGRPASTRVPVAGDDRRCSSCAAAFWQAVVRTGSALAEVRRQLEAEAGPVLVVSPPAPRLERLCVDCQVRPPTPGEKATLCRVCRGDRIRAGIKRRDAAAA